MRAAWITRGFYLAGFLALGQLVAVPAALGQQTPPRRVMGSGGSAATAAGTGGTTGTATPDLSRRLNRIRAEESDEVKRVPVQDPGAGIEQPPDLSSAGRERAVPPPEPREDRPATLPELPKAQRKALFATPPYKNRFDDLGKCQHEVALMRKQSPAEVAAGNLELRWMVAADGNVQGAEVVALSKTDPDVMTCVHRKLSAWRITPAPPTPYRATHQLKFTK